MNLKRNIDIRSIPHYSQKVKKRKAKIGIKTTNVYQAKNYKPL